MKPRIVKAPAASKQKPRTAAQKRMIAKSKERQALRVLEKLRKEGVVV